MAFRIDARQVKARLEAGDKITIIEALPPEYFRKGHLPGAICMDYEDSAEEITRVLPDRHAETVVYCTGATCENSQILANRLLSIGYLNTVAMHEGKDGWVAAGFTLSREQVAV